MHSVTSKSDRKQNNNNSNEKKKNTECLNMTNWNNVKSRNRMAWWLLPFDWHKSIWHLCMVQVYILIVASIQRNASRIRSIQFRQFYLSLFIICFYRSFRFVDIVQSFAALKRFINIDIQNSESYKWWSKKKNRCPREDDKKKISTTEYYRFLAATIAHISRTDQKWSIFLFAAFSLGFTNRPVFFFFCHCSRVGWLDKIDTISNSCFCCVCTISCTEFFDSFPTGISLFIIPIFFMQTSCYKSIQTVGITSSWTTVEIVRLVWTTKKTKKPTKQKLWW